MKLEISQKWISESHPHENFHIYSGIADTFILSDMGIDPSREFEKLPEVAKIFFWERTNRDAFDQFLVSKKGENYTNTYPYAWAGESNKYSIVGKIKKYDMKLVKEEM